MRYIQGFILICVVIFAVWVFVGTAERPVEFVKQDAQANQLADTGIVTEDEFKQWQRIVRSWPLEQQAGFLLIAGFTSTYANAHIEQLIKDYHVSGVNLLGRNVQNATQTIRMTDRLHALNDTKGLPPFIVGADQEGGPINRFVFLKELTGQSALTSVEHANQVAYNRGKELKELGVNMVFGPVVDVVTDPTAYLYKRTFATNTAALVSYAQAMVEGYLDAGVMPVLKHFPGYGNGKPDPHRSAFVITVTDVPAFMASFKALVTSTTTIPVMTSHAIIKPLENLPATFSAQFLKDILRTQYGFKGVVISDDLEMISTNLTPPQAAVAALNAGADLLISTIKEDQHIPIINAIVAGVQDGTITRERFDEAIDRVIQLRLQMKNL